VVLPLGAKLARAEIRPENVRRILLLLFDNSVHALAGQTERKVQINVRVEDDRTGFDFWDNGPGWPPTGRRTSSCRITPPASAPPAWA
jgi:C4-dicarboxylate-specific signal transduction histidine kinase